MKIKSIEDCFLNYKLRLRELCDPIYLAGFLSIRQCDA